MNYRGPMDRAYDAAMRRRLMAVKLGCRPEVVALFQGVTDACLSIWKTQKHYYERRADHGTHRKNG